MYLVGVDTGGTKTRCVVLDRELRLLGTGTSGPGNYHVAGRDGARENVDSAIRRALANAGVDPSEKLVGGFGMGTLDTDEDRTIISGFLDEIEYVDERYVENDVVTAHYAITAGDPGITVVAGTGAMAYGTDGEGSDSRSSGWGWLIGDEGSGFYAARRGLEEATKAYDGRGDPTVLVDAAREYFDLRDFEDVFAKVYREIEHPKNVASFAERVVEAASDGDEVAQRIVSESAEELAAAALAVQRDLDLDAPVRVGCVGGFGTSGVVSKAFERSVRARIPNVEFLDSVNHPVVGAVVILSGEFGLPVDRETLHALDDAIERKRDG